MLSRFMIRPSGTDWKKWMEFCSTDAISSRCNLRRALLPARCPAGTEMAASTIHTADSATYAWKWRRICVCVCAGVCLNRKERTIHYHPLHEATTIIITSDQFVCKLTVKFSQSCARYYTKHQAVTSNGLVGEDASATVPFAGTTMVEMVAV